MKLEAGEDKTNTKSEYTVFTVTPIVEEDYCKRHVYACLCQEKPCLADPSYFCRDDRFTFLVVDMEKLWVHHIFQYPLETQVVPMPAMKKNSIQHPFCPEQPKEYWIDWRKEDG